MPAEWSDPALGQQIKDSDKHTVEKIGFPTRMQFCLDRETLGDNPILLKGMEQPLQLAY